VKKRNLKKMNDIKLEGVIKKDIATSVLTFQGKILILKRSDKVRTYRGMWACVSGYVEKGEEAEEAALREITEELDLAKDDVNLLKKGEVIHARDKKMLWIIHPFLFAVDKTEFKIDWEHIEYKWIFPDEISSHITVPKLKETIESLLS
jgi:8-oxo-dGTP pyrophosphatase MutT (NUDIX family)